MALRATLEARRVLVVLQGRKRVVLAPMELVVVVVMQELVARAVQVAQAPQPVCWGNTPGVAAAVMEIPGDPLIPTAAVAGVTVAAAQAALAQPEPLVLQAQAQTA